MVVTGLTVRPGPEAGVALLSCQGCSVERCRFEGSLEGGATCYCPQAAEIKGGEAIDLGGFRQYVHRRECGRPVEIAFEIDPGRLSGRVAELLRSSHLFGDFARELDREGGVRVERFGLVVDGRGER